MVIKIPEDTQDNTAKYRSSKLVLTSKDINDANKFDARLSSEIIRIEDQIKKLAFNEMGRKQNKLREWYIIGKKLNQFRKKYKISPDEEKYFWETLYKKFSIIRSNKIKTRNKSTRNDYKIASLLANYPYKKIKQIQVWDLWRHIVSYRGFRDDARVREWVITKIQKSGIQSRDMMRPLLLAVTRRLKNLDTSVLKDKELERKLNEIKWRYKHQPDNKQNL